MKIKLVHSKKASGNATNNKITHYADASVIDVTNIASRSIIGFNLTLQAVGRDHIMYKYNVIDVSLLQLI